MAGSAGKIPVLGQGSKISSEKLYMCVQVMRQCFSISQIGFGLVAYVTTNMYLVWNLWSKYAAAWMGSALCVKQGGLLLPIACEPNQFVTWKHMIFYYSVTEMYFL